MSNSSSDRVLNEAYELIEADKLAEAEELLKPILEQEPDNVDAWWLYAHAVTDPESARMSLNQVLRLDNSYDEARALLNKLDDTQSYEIETEPVTTVDIPPSLPDENIDFEIAEQASGLDDSGPIFGEPFDDEPSTARTRNRSLPIILGILIVLALIVLAVLLLLNPFATTPSTDVATEEPTQIVQQQQVEDSTSAFPSPTAEEVSMLPIELGATSDSNIATITGALQDSGLVSDAVGTTQTSLGNSLLAAICTSNTSSAMRETTNTAMTALATSSSSLDGDAEALGVALIDCDVTNNVLRIIAVPLETATAFGDGTLDTEAYESQWVAAG